jgi:hypothetical protein
MKHLLILAFFNVIWAGTLIAYKVLGDFLPVGVVCNNPIWACRSYYSHALEIF